MNPFVFACITPHGGEIIPELAGNNPARMSRSRRSMEQLGRQMRDAQPDTIIYLTPHGIRAAHAFSILDTEHVRGSLEENDGHFAAHRRVDRRLSRMIANQAREDGLPVAQLNYATSGGPLSSLPLDWGVLVPLRFMPETPVVVITTCYDLSFEQHRELGQSIARAVEDSGQKVGLVASCDWAHAHDPDGPYGFDPAAGQLDSRVVELVKANQLKDLAGFDQDFIDAAKPDGIWQALVLAGAIPAASRQVNFLSYEVPTYFGLLCAAVS